MEVIKLDAETFDFSGAVLVHGVNCQGKMNSGLAKVIRKRYPEVYDKYMECHTNYRLKDFLGDFQIVACHDGTTVINAFTQEYYGKGEIRFC